MAALFGRERAAWLGAALALLAPLPAAAKRLGPPTLCPADGMQSALVARVDDRLDLALRDGRVLHLAGLDPVGPTAQAPDLPSKARDALAAHVGGGVRFWPLATMADRWGRIPAFVYVGPPSAPESLADFLLAQGFARFMPGQETHACRAAFLRAEEKARKAKLGLWRDPYYAIIAATNRAAFADKGASNVIVEGRLVAVTSGPYRLSLEFAPRPQHAFSVTILQRNVAIFDRSGLDFHALIGRILRIRGLLDLRFGPQIESASADDIEVIPDGQKQGGMARQGDMSVAPPAQDP